jgi:filamentous hemagglutinin family protein
MWARGCSSLGWRSPLARTIAITTISTAISWGGVAQAQLTPDTAPNTNLGTVVAPQEVYQGLPINRIQGGTRSISGDGNPGFNLFHSFSEFNVGAGQGVYFDNPAGVTNILTRVTGGNPSNILGRLGVFGTANLFLLNPSGVVFGPNASLDVQGSFTASTAPAIGLGAGQFGMVNPVVPTLVDVQPDALFLNALGAVNARGAIVNQGTLQPGQTLTLNSNALTNTGILQAGQGLSLNANTLTNAGTAIGQTGTINSGSFVNPGTVQTPQGLALNATTVNSTGALLAENGALSVTATDVTALSTLTAQNATVVANQNLTLGSSQLNTTGNLSLTAGNQMLLSDAATQPFNATAGGTLTLQAGQGVDINILKNPLSTISSGGALTIASPAGNTAVSGRLTGGSLALTGRSTAITDSNLTSTTGPVAISATNGSLSLAQGRINAATTLALSATDTVTLRDLSALPIQLSANGTLTIQGNQGIDIQTVDPASLLQTGGNLQLSSSAGPISAKIPLQVAGAFGIASAGDIGLGDFTGQSLSLSSTGNIAIGNINTSNGQGGNGGQVMLSARRSITTGTINTSATFGNGGPVNLIAGTGISTGAITTNAQGANASGAVTLVAGGNILANGISSTAVAGNGGAIQLISTSGSVDTRGGVINTQSIIGTSGTVELRAFGDIFTQNISTSSFSGNSGAIALTSLAGNIDTTAAVGGLDASTATIRAGRGGAITLTADRNVSVGSIFSDGGLGASGAIAVTSRSGNITVSPGTINSRTYGSEPSGSIQFQTGPDGTISMNGTTLSTSPDPQVAAAGDGGRVDIVGGKVLLNTTTIDSSTATAGNGGSITIVGQAPGQSVVLQGNTTLNSSTTSTGKGGDISISGQSVLLQQGATLNSSTTAAGNGGSIGITGQTVTLQGDTTLNSKTQGSGNGGGVTIRGQAIALQGSTVDSSISSTGKGGDLTLSADGLLQITDSSIRSKVEPGGTNTGGTIALTAGQLALGNATIDTTTAGSGSGGSILMTATAGDISLAQNSLIRSNTSGSGNSGTISITAPTGALDLNSQSSINTDTSGIGNGGSIRLSTNSVRLNDFSTITAKTLSSGNGGSVSVNAPAQVRLANSSSISTTVDATAATGIGGTINLATRDLSVTGGSRLQASTRGLGAAGDIQIDAPLIVVAGANASGAYSGLLTDSETPNSGRGGSILINSFTNPQGKLQVFNSGFLSTGSRGQSPAGDIRVGVESLQLLNGGQLISSATGNGAAGTIAVNATREVVVSGSNPAFAGNTAKNPNEGSASGLFAQSLGSGPAGNLLIRTANMQLLNSGQATVSSFGSGNGGNIDVNVRSLTLSDRSRLAGDTVSGTGGNLQVASRTLRVLTGSEISTSTETGQAGQIVANVNSLLLNSGSIISRSTGTGNAGEIALGVSDRLQVDNGIISASSRAGNGGRIGITAANARFEGGSVVSSSSDAIGDAGSISVQVGDRLQIRGSTISAASTDGGGGTIGIRAADILFTDGSLISSSVSNGSGGGGNISIQASRTFFAFRDSDILANAQFGEGGNISIKAPVFVADLFANVGRNPGKDFSRFRGNDRVDISSSSSFGVNGTVQIPDTSFIQNSLSTLDSTFINAEAIVAGSCLARRNAEQGSFVVTGTGGLARSPYAQISGRYNTLNIQGVDGSSPSAPDANELKQSKTPTRDRAPDTASPYVSWKPGDPIQEARGFMTTPDGRVVIGTAPELVAIAKAQNLVCHFDVK